VKFYTAVAARCGAALLQRGPGLDKSPTAKAPRSPQKAKTKAEVRHRTVVEFVTWRGAPEAEGPPAATPADEFAALVALQLDWIPIRDPRKAERPKERGWDAGLTCRSPRCPSRYIVKQYVACGACDAPYCGYACQKEDWPLHQQQGSCNRGLRKHLRRALSSLDLTLLEPHLPFLRLMTSALGRLNPFTGTVWYSMAYLREADWLLYVRLEAKTSGEDPGGGGGGGGATFGWGCPTFGHTSRPRAEALLLKQRETAWTPRILFEIKCTEGYRVHHLLEPLASPQASTGIPAPDERRDEVLLPMGAVFRVLSSSCANSFLQLVVEQLPAPYLSLPD